MHLYIENVNGGAILEMYQLLEQWDEGNKNQDEGAGNWSQSSQNQSWTPGGNFSGQALISEAVNNVGWISFTLPNFLIQEWMDDPSSNYGIILTNALPISNSILGIGSKESNFAPYLMIELNPENCGTGLSRQEEPKTTLNRTIIALKNGAGVTTNSFVAGTTDEEHELVIEGSGFGNTTGSVIFPNADNGGLNQITVQYASDFINWTDSEIRLKIPKNAGTGTITVLSTAGAPVGSAQIEIDWALNPLYHDYREFDEFTRQRINLINANDNGGYTILINSESGLLANTEAVAAIERALGKWQCSSGINFVVDKSGSNLPIANDGHSVIAFSTTLPIGVLAITSSRYKGAGSSSCSQTSTLWRVKEFDMEFADPSILPAGISWNYGEGNPSITQFDFESIALHEFGHAHGLAHVIDGESVMHFSIGNGEVKRRLHNHELDGAAHKMSYSITNNCVSTHKPMISHAGGEDCEDNTATPSINPNGLRVKVLLEGFYNSGFGTLATNLATAGLVPSTQPYGNAPFNYAGNEATTFIPNDIVDWVLLELRDANDRDNVLYQGAYLLREDGQVLTANGSEVLPLPDVASGSYFIAIDHLNHIPIISSSPHAVNTDNVLYDFSTSESQAMGDGQLKDIDGQAFMNSGDFDGNGLINNEDYNLWKTNSASLNVYSSSDADGNGIINSIDYNFWKKNRSKIGLITR